MAAGETMQGRRVEYPGDWRDSQPGDYCKVPEGEGPKRADGKPVWYVRDPFGHVGTLLTHTVEEHEDGTITVMPSILDPGEYEDFKAGAAEHGGAAIIDQNRAGWHGFLERGVWREV